VRGTTGDDTLEFETDVGRGLGRLEKVEGSPEGGGADVGRSKPGAAFMVLCISAVTS
jgi:hypothetical protein